MNKNPKTWNKGKAVGQMKPLTTKQVELIRGTLELVGNLRDMALFATAIDSMLRSVDLLHLKVEDVVDSTGTVRDKFSIQQQKTSKPVGILLFPKTMEILTEWIEASGKIPSDYLFTGLRRSKDRPITHEMYRNLVKKWVKDIKLDPSQYSTHSLRRSKASLIYEKTNNVEAVRILLGQSSVAATSHYLGLEQKDALEISRQIAM